MMQVRLETILARLAPLTVAVSGGVDSMTLACVAGRTLGPKRMTAVHAVSPAVPGEATGRVRAFAAERGWSLRVLDAGEFADPRYRANPVNRCFFCKTNLYGAVRAAIGPTGHIVAGTNADDLGEYRPGLDAAADHGVHHPYVEAGMDKAAVRALARELGLGGIADLPAAPCLSSRVETGIRIDAATLAFVHAVEHMVGEHLGESHASRAVRCRVRAAGTVIELDPASLAALDDIERDGLQAAILDIAPAGLDRRLTFAPYRTGSAFLTGAVS